MDAPSTKLRSIFLLIVCMYMMCSCASPQFVQRDFFQEDTASKLQWPPSPQEPRIVYTGSIKDPLDRAKDRSWIKNIVSGIFGEDEEMSTMLRPYGVFADSNRVYVADPGLGRLHIYDRDKERYYSIQRAGEDDLISPIGVGTDGKGNIYVSDSVLKHVFIFDKEGKHLRSFGPPDTFQRPAGIALADDRVYVVDTHGHKIFVLSQVDGSALFSFGRQGTGQGNFNYPTNIFISRENLIYVTDSMNFRVQIFKPDGSFITSFGKLGDSTGNFSKPKGIAVDSDGHIYVVDSHFDNVQVFDVRGNLLLVLGSSGHGRGEFILPAGIYIDSSDKIYVADSYNKRIQMFQYLKEKKDVNKQ